MGPTKRGAHLSATERQGNLSSPSSPFQNHRLTSPSSPLQNHPLSSPSSPLQNHRLAAPSSPLQDHRLSSHLPKLAPDLSEGHLCRGCSSESGRSPAATRQS